MFCGYSSNAPQTFLESFAIIPRLFLKYSENIFDIPQIFPEYSQNIPQIFPQLTFSEYSGESL
jgi:hypothetical protein